MIARCGVLIDGPLEMVEFSHMNGALNFRDLGGLSTHGGKRVRSGLVYRSGTLHALTDAGIAQLSALGIAAIYDLRSDPERASRPPRLPADGSIQHLYYSHERETGNLFAALRDPGRNANDAREVMLRIYRKLPFDLVPPYRQLFRHIAEGATPIVFNCAAGKDRTGFAASVLLHALEIPAETVIEDYLGSTKALAAIRDMFMTGPRAALVSGVDPSIWEPILRVDPVYLQTAFDAVVARHGSIMGYLREALEVSDTDVAAMRARLLE